MISKAYSRLQVFSLFRFATTKKQREQLAKKISQNPIERFNTYFATNSETVHDNFKQFRDSPKLVEKNQIETRILKRIYDSQLLDDLKSFEFSKDLRSDLKLDSLNITVLLTEIQNQFTTVFEDKVFESVRNLREIVDILARDEKII